jgi:ribosomal-protein-alanine N-acetyltransferase
MLDRWTDRVPRLQGGLTTLREIDAADVYPLFKLLSDPAVTSYMAPAPPTLAKFAGFIQWSHEQRSEGRGVCFGIVPEGMEVAVGIVQVRRLEGTASRFEWGFVLSAYFWSTGVFSDAATALAECAFTTMHIDRLEARIALRNRRAQSAMQKLGARFDTILESDAPKGITRDPEAVWVLSPGDWANRTRDQHAPPDAAERLRAAIEAAEGDLMRSEFPVGVEPYPLFLFDRRRRE